MLNIKLRPIKLDDAKYFVKFLKNDTDAINNMSHQLFPCTKKNAEKWIKDRIDDGGYIFAIIKNEKEFVGIVGFSNIENNETKIGYWVGKKHRNQGFASKAILLALEHAKSLGVVKIYADTLPNNEASIKVLQKNNFVHKETREVNFTAVGINLNLSTFVLDFV